MASLLVYDGDCGFCTTAVGIVQRRIGSTAEMQPWQSLDLDAFGLTQSECQRAVQYRNRVGKWTSAGRAAAELLCEAPPPWPWTGRFLKLPGLSRLTELAYKVISANRHRLPGSTPECGVSRP